MCLVEKFVQRPQISRVESEVLLNLVKFFELSLLQSLENRQFCLVCLSIAKNMSNPLLFTESR